jgi:hypothetical protein
MRQQLSIEKRKMHLNKMTDNKSFFLDIFIFQIF